MCVFCVQNILIKIIIIVINCPDNLNYYITNLFKTDLRENMIHIDDVTIRTSQGCNNFQLYHLGKRTRNYCTPMTCYHVKYVGWGTRGFYKFFKKKFVAQETIDLNISWSSNFFGKYFMIPPINFSFLFKAYLQQYFRVVLTVVFKF